MILEYFMNCSLHSLSYYVHKNPHSTVLSPQITKIEAYLLPGNLKVATVSQNSIQFITINETIS